MGIFESIHFIFWLSVITVACGVVVCSVLCIIAAIINMELESITKFIKNKYYQHFPKKEKRKANTVLVRSFYFE